MEIENLTFIEAVKKIAKDNGIAIEYDKELTEEEQAAARHKETLLTVNELAHRYFVECLRTDMSDEGRYTRDYAYAWWPEDFCATSGIGYAPRKAVPLSNTVSKKSIIR